MIANVIGNIYPCRTMYADGEGIFGQYSIAVTMIDMSLYLYKNSLISEFNIFNNLHLEREYNKSSHYNPGYSFSFDGKVW